VVIPLLRDAVVGLLALSVVGCNLNLDESLIKEGTAPTDASTDPVVPAIDGSLDSKSEADTSLSADADAAIDPSQDPIGDPVTEHETGLLDTKSDSIDTGTDTDSGCSVGADAGACLSCVQQKCCAKVAECALNTLCHLAFGSFETCENSPKVDASADGGAQCLSQLGSSGGQVAAGLVTCISSSCSSCSP
jgi:hypothetical protein